MSERERERERERSIDYAYMRQRFHCCHDPVEREREGKTSKRAEGSVREQEGRKAVCTSSFRWRAVYLSFFPIRFVSTRTHTHARTHTHTRTHTEREREGEGDRSLETHRMKPEVHFVPFAVFIHVSSSEVRIDPGVTGKRRTRRG